MNNLISFTVQIMTYNEFNLYESEHLAVDEDHARELAYNGAGLEPHIKDMVAIFKEGSSISLPIAPTPYTHEEANQCDIEDNWFWDDAFMIEWDLRGGRVCRYNSAWERMQSNPDNNGEYNVFGIHQMYEQGAHYTMEEAEREYGSELKLMMNGRSCHNVMLFTRFDKTKHEVEDEAHQFNMM